MMGSRLEVSMEAFGAGSGSARSVWPMKMWMDPIWTRNPDSMELASEPQVESSMQIFPRWVLMIHPATNPSMPYRYPSRISTPASAGPTVGANCRGKVTTDVRRVELNMGPLLRGDFVERVDMDKRLGDLPRFQPLFVLR